ncbi:MAG: hypothetical protein LUI39_13635 [Lachnospiraceae bacterium]|nr:hypothetical protein [Lachnospiraceae bacterium]
MRKRANMLDYTQVAVKGIPALFTDAKVEAESVPEGFYLYEVRYDDAVLGDPIQIGKCIVTNFLGSLLMSEELEIPWSGYLDIDAESDWECGEFIGTLNDGIRAVRRMVFRSTLCRENILTGRGAYGKERYRQWT